jgi:hypothetical protein
MRQRITSACGPVRTIIDVDDALLDAAQEKLGTTPPRRTPSTKPCATSRSVARARAVLDDRFLLGGADLTDAKVMRAPVGDHRVPGRHLRLHRAEKRCAPAEALGLRTAMAGWREQAYADSRTRLCTAQAIYGGERFARPDLGRAERSQPCVPLGDIWSWPPLHLRSA